MSLPVRIYLALKKGSKTDKQAEVSAVCICGCIFYIPRMFFSCRTFPFFVEGYQDFKCAYGNVRLMGTCVVSLLTACLRIALVSRKLSIPKRVNHCAPRFKILVQAVLISLPSFGSGIYSVNTMAQVAAANEHGRSKDRAKQLTRPIRTSCLREVWNK
jgi:hypothetical protein